MCLKCPGLRYTPTMMTESMTYKDLVADLVPNEVAGMTLAKLPVRDWAPLVKSVHYQGWKGNTLKFFVPNTYNGWNTYFRFEQFDEQVADTSINANEAARLLLWAGDMQLYCACPSFSYHGYQYILTQLDASIVPEDRFPKKNNPHLLGWGCKHLRKAVKVLPFHLGHIASAIKGAREGLDGSADYDANYSDE